MWKRFLACGVLGLFVAIAIGLISLLAPTLLEPEGRSIPPVVLEVALGIGGAAVVGWSLWLRKLWDLEQEAWEAFYPEPEGGW